MQGCMVIDLSRQAVRPQPHLGLRLAPQTQPSLPASRPSCRSSGIALELHTPGRGQLLVAYAAKQTKVQTVWVCRECGHQYKRWLGKCSECNKYNTIDEQVLHKSPGDGGGAGTPLFNSGGVGVGGRPMQTIIV